jgi:hypothetical protein
MATLTASFIRRCTLPTSLFISILCLEDLLALLMCLVCKGRRTPLMWICLIIVRHRLLVHSTYQTRLTKRGYQKRTKLFKFPVDRFSRSVILIVEECSGQSSLCTTIARSQLDHARRSINSCTYSFWLFGRWDQELMHATRLCPSETLLSD